MGWEGINVKKIVPTPINEQLYKIIRITEEMAKLEK